MSEKTVKYDRITLLIVRLFNSTFSIQGQLQNELDPLMAARLLEIAPALPPLQLQVPEPWLDYNGHMSEAYFLVACGDSADAFFASLGVAEAYRQSGYSFFTRETYLRHCAEVPPRARLTLRLYLLQCQADRLHIYHSISTADGNTVYAFAEQVLVHVSLSSRRPAPMPAELLAQLAEHCKISDAVGTAWQLKL